MEGVEIMGRMPEVIAHAGIRSRHPKGTDKTDRIRIKRGSVEDRQAAYEQRQQESAAAKERRQQEINRASYQTSGYQQSNIHARNAQQKSYASYERAANKQEYGPHATRTARNYHRLQSELDYDANKSKAQRFADNVRNNVKLSKNVPSQNPTAGGGYTPVNDGKERAGHKYKAKVRTKSGKIRYIYDNVETASGKHGSIKDAFDSQKHAKHVSNKAAYMNAWKRREKSENAQRARNADPVNQVRKFANRTVRQVARAAGGAMDAARGFLKQFGIG